MFKTSIEPKTFMKKPSKSLWSAWKAPIWKCGPSRYNTKLQAAREPSLK